MGEAQGLDLNLLELKANENGVLDLEGRGSKKVRVELTLRSVR